MITVTRPGVRGVVLTGLWALLAATAASAQDVDPRWQPFLGCWQPVGDAADSEALLCVVPGEASGTMQVESWLAGERVATEPLRADGRPLEITRDQCVDTDRAQFATRSGLVFIDTEHVCDGETVGATSAILAIVSPTEFVDIQVVQADGEGAAGVIRYRRAGREAAAATGHAAWIETSARVRSARFAAAAPPSVEDVIEATRMAAHPAVEAWLIEHGEPLELDAAALEALADAEVPASVIDMAIAVSYPETFAVEPGAGGRMEPTVVPLGDRAGRRAFGRRGFCGGFGCPAYGGYGYYGYGYSPFYRYGAGFGYGGYGAWGYAPRILVVNGRVRAGGRVIQGRGYTRDRGGTTISSGGGEDRGSSRRSSGRKAKRRGG